jgi:hypothetical protein
MEEFFYSEIINNDIDPKPFEHLYSKEDFQGIFSLALKFDLFCLVEYLYTNYSVKFYINEYLNVIDIDLLNILNQDEIDNKNHCFKINYSSNENQSYKYLLEMRKYSKLKKDEKGFYYLYKKSS